LKTAPKVTSMAIGSQDPSTRSHTVSRIFLVLRQAVTATLLNHFPIGRYHEGRRIETIPFSATCALQKSDTPREAGGLMGWAASKAVGLRV
jgi:hypothetical protein